MDIVDDVESILYIGREVSGVYERFSSFTNTN